MTVLGDKGLTERFDEIFVPGTADRERIRAAKYYLALGDRALILPDGSRYLEDDSQGPPLYGSFVLEPGQTALVSTSEKLMMPTDLAGIVGPVFDHSKTGLLLFGGMLIDPGLGLERRGDAWVDAPEPLSFYLANLGSEPFQLTPGYDRIASIAFVLVDQPHQRQSLPEHLETDSARNARRGLFDPRRPDGTGPQRALGLVEEIGDLVHRVERFEESTKQVVLFGVLVLAVTLFAAVVALLSTEAGKSLELRLQWYEVLPALYLIAAVPAGLTGCFYLWVKAKRENQKLQLEQQRMAELRPPPA